VIKKQASAADILVFTQDILVAVIAEQWDDLAALQQEQSQMLRDFFSDAVVASEADKVNFIEVQRLNKEILVAVERYKSELATELRGIKVGRLKVGSYQST